MKTGLPIELDRFTIHDFYRSGGMACVWRGRASDETPVAVKTLLPEMADNAMFRLALFNEVRQIARMRHKNIVQLFERGTLPPEAEAATAALPFSQRLIAGVPYFIMEYAELGSLQDRLLRGYPTTWTEVQAILTDVLEALVHAHARQVLHRDIKPGNILLFSQPDGSTTYKVADFGIAHHYGSATRQFGAGTPEYMAPEQTARRLHPQQGPWTDLYAVGVLAYQLLTHMLPFSPPDGMTDTSKRREYILEQHRTATLPAGMLPRVSGVPAGIQAWVYNLMQKSPMARPTMARHALEALQALQSAPLAVTTAQPAPAVGGIETWAGETAFETEPGSESASDPEIPQPVPLPPTIVDSSAAGARRGGASLGLFGLRDIGVIGRDSQKEYLLKAIDAVRSCDPPEAQLVWLDGPTGVGKRRLAWWLMEHCAALGIADVLWADQSSPHHPLIEMVARRLGCLHCPPELLSEHLEQIQDWPGVHRIALALRRWLSQDNDALGTESLRSRDALLWDFFRAQANDLRRRAQRGLLILYVESAHRSPELVSSILQQLKHVAAPILVVLSTDTQDETLADPARAQLQRQAVSPLVVPPLAASDMRALVREMLPLRDSVVEQLIACSSGHPMFATELLREWITRGLLVFVDEQLDLRASAPTPKDFAGLWSLRLERLPDAADQQALQLAALLDRWLDSETHWHACKEFGLSVRAQLLDQLVAEGLLELRAGRLCFVHRTLQRLLVAPVQDGAAANRACAAALQATAARAENRHLAQEAIGRHLAAAQVWADCVEPLRQGASGRLREGDFPGAQELIDLRAKIIDDHLHDTSPPTDAPQRVQIAIANGKAEEAEALCRAWLAGVPFPDAQRLEALRALGLVLEKRGHQADRAEAMDCFTQVIAIAEKLGTLPEELGASCAELRGYCEMHLGTLLRKPDAALSLFRAALSRLVGHRKDWRADCLLIIGGALLEQGEDWQEAKKHLQEARQLFEALGHWAGVADVLNNLGEVYRKGAHDLERAWDSYTEGLAVADGLWLRSRAILHLNLGQVELARGNHSESRRCAEALLGETRIPQYLLCAHILRLPALAAAGDWPEWDTSLSEAERLEAVTGFRDRDLPQLVGQAVALAATAGQDARAAAARRFQALL